MSDMAEFERLLQSISDDNTPLTGGDNFFAFFALVFLALCFCYCCRNAVPRDDPAQDLLGAWIPNSSTRLAAAATAAAAGTTVEEKRQHIEDALIVRKVIAYDDDNNNNNNNNNNKEETKEQSEQEKSEQRPSMMKRLAKSERNFASYAAALNVVTSNRKVLKFSEPTGTVRHAMSLPSGFKATFIEEVDVNVNVDVEANEGMLDEKLCNTLNHAAHASNKPSIKHRRKSDIVARTLARTLSKQQDYDQPTTCDICLLDYEVGEEVAWSPNDGCIHAFHKECITDWLLRNPKCPLCRRDYLELEFPATTTAAAAAAS